MILKDTFILNTIIQSISSSCFKTAHKVKKVVFHADLINEPNIITYVVLKRVVTLFPRCFCWCFILIYIYCYICQSRLPFQISSGRKVESRAQIPPKNRCPKMPPVRRDPLRPPEGRSVVSLLSGPEITDVTGLLWTRSSLWPSE